MRTPSQAAHELIESFERTILWTYDDATGRRMAVGVPALGTPTIGRGNTRRALPVRQITALEAEDYYVEDCADVSRTIARWVPAKTLLGMPQPCYDGLFSFVFNVGVQAFVGKGGKRTQLLQTIINDPAGVPAQMRRWVYSAGRKLAGLVRRRDAEANLWAKGLLAENPEPARPHNERVMPEPPKAAIASGPVLQRPAVGATTTAVGTAGAVATETAQQLSFMQSETGQIVQLICLLLVLLGAGLTIWALIKQSKEGRA